MNQPWQSTSTLANLRLRATLLAKLRTFFGDRGVLEVETPQFNDSVAVERGIEPFLTQFKSVGGFFSPPLYLQTSPEMYMKRLLAQGVGPIYQVARVFRNGEVGAKHLPEFTLVEWYRPGWNYQQLMQEVADLVDHLIGIKNTQWLTFREAFIRFAQVDPFLASNDELMDHTELSSPYPAWERDDILDYLLVTKVEPKLKQWASLFITDYPPSQAAMAIIDPGPPAIGRRFELYVHGLELANGYEELTDAHEQERRFHHENRVRQSHGLPLLTIDRLFLAALRMGMEPVSGVALGFDRLVMLAAGVENIAEVVAFANDYRGGLGEIISPSGGLEAKPPGC